MIPCLTKDDDDDNDDDEKWQIMNCHNIMKSDVSNGIRKMKCYHLKKI